MISSQNSINLYTDAKLLDEHADESVTGTGENRTEVGYKYSGDSLIQVEDELSVAIAKSASEIEGLDNALFVEIAREAIEELNDEGIEALTYQSTIALIEDIEYMYNQRIGAGVFGNNSDVTFDDFDFNDADGSGVIGDEAGEYGFGMSAGLRLPAGMDVNVMQSRLNEIWGMFGGSAPQIEERDGLILVNGEVVNGATDLLPPEAQGFLMEGGLAYGGGDGFGAKGDDTTLLEAQFGIDVADGQDNRGDDAGFMWGFQKLGSANARILGDDGTLAKNASAVDANKATFVETMAQLVLFGGYNLDPDTGKMSHPTETKLNLDAMREKLPIFMALENSAQDEFSGYGFSTIFDSVLGTTNGTGLSNSILGMSLSDVYANLQSLADNDTSGRYTQLGISLNNILEAAAAAGR